MKKSISDETKGSIMSYHLTNKHMPKEAIAKMLGVSVGTVNRVLKRALHPTPENPAYQFAKRLSDDLNPEFIFSNTDTSLLVMVAQGKIDSKFLAHKQLAARGLNASGQWVGFKEAEKFLSQKYN